jgi:hypothetical protein
MVAGGIEKPPTPTNPPARTTVPSLAAFPRALQWVPLSGVVSLYSEVSGFVKFWKALGRRAVCVR